MVVNFLTGCSTTSNARLVVVNERIGYVKVLDRGSTVTLLDAIAESKVDENAKSFADFHGGDNWGGAMYDVYKSVRRNVYVRLFIFDSSGHFLEDHSKDPPSVKILGSAKGSMAYRILSPWKNEAEEKLADEIPKSELKYGIFP
jgi:hypothetical protein